MEFYDIIYLFKCYFNSQMQLKYITWTFIRNFYILYRNWDIHNFFFYIIKKINNWKNNYGCYYGLSAKTYFLQITKFQAIAENKYNRTKT